MSDRKRNAMLQALREAWPAAPMREAVHIVIEVDATTMGDDVIGALAIVTNTVRYIAAATANWLRDDLDRVKAAHLIWHAWRWTIIDPLAGARVDGLVLKPWVLGCWDEDGWTTTQHITDAAEDCDDTRCCVYHEQWIRIGGRNSMRAWVEPADGGGFEAWVWEHRLGENVVVRGTSGGFETEDLARAGADEAMELMIKNAMATAEADRLNYFDEGTA